MVPFLHVFNLNPSASGPALPSTARRRFALISIASGPSKAAKIEMMRDDWALSPDITGETERGRSHYAADANLAPFAAANLRRSGEPGFRRKRRRGSIEKNQTPPPPPLPSHHHLVQQTEDQLRQEGAGDEKDERRKEGR